MEVTFPGSTDEDVGIFGRALFSLPQETRVDYSKHREQLGLRPGVWGWGQVGASSRAWM